MVHAMPYLRESAAELSAYVSCDPGSTGAVALVHGNSCHVYAVPLSETPIGGSVIDDLATLELARMLAAFGPVAFVIEHTWGIRGQGGSSQYKFGDTAGALRMAFAATGLPVFRVPAQRWRTRLRVHGAKANSVAVAKSLFPDHAAEFTPVRADARRGVVGRTAAQCEGRAEAALIGRYAQVMKLGRAP